jgi:hypothetical protein
MTSRSRQSNELDRVDRGSSDPFDRVRQGGNLASQSLLDSRHRLGGLERAKQVFGGRVERADDILLEMRAAGTEDRLAAGQRRLIGRGLVQGTIRVLNDL